MPLARRRVTGPGPSGLAAKTLQLLLDDEDSTNKFAHVANQVAAANIPPSIASRGSAQHYSRGSLPVASRRTTGSDFTDCLGLEVSMESLEAQGKRSVVTDGQVMVLVAPLLVPRWRRDDWDLHFFPSRGPDRTFRTSWAIS